ncbi:hypothetical protein G9A89_017834 [Geosiphon pyriformis]|nr:hypothetical protein G9A89_017834 [Geosiphon pyriformis]
MEDFYVGLEQQLIQLSTASDTTVIRTATTTLNIQYYNNVNCVPALVEIISKSQLWQVRQLAAVEARKRVLKWWSKLDINSQNLIKSRLLEVILQEAQSLVSHATARVISSIAKVELPAGTWGDLPQFLFNCCKSPTASQREVGVYVLYTLFDTLTDIFLDHKQFFQLFTNTINDPVSKEVRITTLQALGKVAESIESEAQSEIKLFQDLIPSMVNVLQQCLNDNDEDSANRGFEVFDGLLMLEVPLLSNHIPQLIEFFLNVAQNKDYQGSMRVMALQFLIWATVYKKAKIQRLKLVGPIIERLMPIGTEDDPDDADEDSPSRLAFRVINTLSTNLPPAQVFPAVINQVVGYMQNPDPKFRKAAMMAFAVLIEGCADHIRPKFNELLPIVCTGLQDPETIVRRAACIALGSFAEELDQEIAVNHATLLPLVFNLLNDPSPDIPKHACNALDAILEGLGDEIIQYLPILMEKMLNILDYGSDEVKATVTAAIGSAAHAAGEEFKPYFEEVIKRLHALMSINQGTEALMLRGVATDTIGAVAEAVGKEVFQDHFHELMRMAIEGIQLDSARLRECSYCLFAVMARVFQGDFAPYLEAVMPQLIKTCQIEEKNLFNISENLEAEQNEEDEDDVDELIVNSAVVDEKEIAADAIGEIFEHTRGHFLPYVETCTKELQKLCNHYSEGVRKAAACSLFNFLATFYLMSDPAPWQPGLPVKVPLHENVTTMAKAVFPEILTMWEEEESKMVVVQICQELNEVLKGCGPAVIADYVDQIANNCLQILQKQAACQQDQEDEEGILDEDEEAEHDALLINACSDLVAAMALALGSDFASYFKKKTKPTSDRSMAIGCLGECVLGLKSASSQFTEQLLPIFLKALGDEDDEVRSNAAYAIGLLCFYTNVNIIGQYGAILTALHPLITRQSASNVTDNACGAVCRMILAHSEAIPLDQVLEVLIRTLPLKKDYQENEPVYQCIFQLFRINNSFILNNIPQLLNIFGQVLSPPEDQLTDKTRHELIELIHALHQQFPDMVNQSGLTTLLQAQS